MVAFVDAPSATNKRGVTTRLAETSLDASAVIRDTGPVIVFRAPFTRQLDGGR